MEKDMSRVTPLFCDSSRRPLLRGKKHADAGSGASHIDSEPIYKVTVSCPRFLSSSRRDS